MKKRDFIALLCIIIILVIFGCSKNDTTKQDNDIKCQTNSKQNCSVEGKLGECIYGEKTCTEEGSWNSCIQIVYPKEEICDGKDNDCDGTTDNNLTVACAENSKCGADGFSGARYCTNGNVFQNYTNYTCLNAGKCTSVCESHSQTKLFQDCNKAGCTIDKCDSQALDKCTDSDKGKNINLFGKITGIINSEQYNYSDYCIGNEKVREFYCNQTYNKSSIVSCGTDFNSTNYCKNSSIYFNSTNYYCKSGVCDKEVILHRIATCELGCSNGACDNETTDSCSDSDNGINVSIYGNVIGFHNNIAFNNSDSCMDSGNITEYYCSEASRESSTQNCGIDSYSSNYCRDTDVYRNFTDYYCISGYCTISITPQIVQSCQFGCINGSCNTTQVADSCSDTDGGNMINILGTVSGYYNSQQYTSSDYCADLSTLSEYYCTSQIKNNQNQSCGTDINGSDYCQGSAVYRNITDYFCSAGACAQTITAQLVQNCEVGCTSGACSAPSPDSCSDSDGGNVANTKGTATGYHDGVQYNNIDNCIDSNNLVEYYCSGTHWFSAPITCTGNYTCTNGACS